MMRFGSDKALEMIQSPLIKRKERSNYPMKERRKRRATIGTACLKMYDTHAVESMGERIALQGVLLESVLGK